MIVKPVNLAEILGSGTRRLKQSGIACARLDCLLLIEKVLQRDRAWVLSHLDFDQISPKEADTIENMVRRRARRLPLAYIIGEAWFYGRKFTLTPDVLIPRPESEMLISVAKKMVPIKSRVIDIGTGSGALAISLGLERPDLEILASDISPHALEVARQNARKYSRNDINFQISDIMHDIEGRVGVIIANLPYLKNGQTIDPEAYHEPAAALFSGPDGLAHYKKLFRQVGRHLESPGLIILEAEPDQYVDLEKLGSKAGCELVHHTGFCYVFRCMDVPNLSKASAE